MTCYFRHLRRVFEKAGIEVTKANRSEIDRVIHQIVMVNYKNCPSTWKEVRKRITENEDEFASLLRQKWKKLT